MLRWRGPCVLSSPPEAPEPHPEVDIGHLGFGSVACSCSDSWPEPSPPAGSRLTSRSALQESCPACPRPARRSPVSRSIRCSRWSWIPWPRSIASATRSAWHVIVAPLVARVAAEHGLPDLWGHAQRPTLGTSLLWVSGIEHFEVIRRLACRVGPGGRWRKSLRLMSHGTGAGKVRTRNVSRVYLVAIFTACDNGLVVAARPAVGTRGRTKATDGNRALA